MINYNKAALKSNTELKPFPSGRDFALGSPKVTDDKVAMGLLRNDKLFRNHGSVQGQFVVQAPLSSYAAEEPEAPRLPLHVRGRILLVAAVLPWLGLYIIFSYMF